MSDAELRQLLLRFPRIIEYKTERTIRPRLDFLKKCGVAQGELCKVVLRAPMTMELSVEDTLEPRAAFLREKARPPRRQTRPLHEHALRRQTRCRGARTA
jgi:mTERF